MLSYISVTTDFSQLLFSVLVLTTNRERFVQGCLLIEIVNFLRQVTSVSTISVLTLANCSSITNSREDEFRLVTVLNRVS